MYRHLTRLGLACAVALASLAVGVAQERPKDPEDYRRFFRKPENPVEFWKAIQFELDVGRPDLAARHIRGLLASKPTDAELHTLIDQVGLTPILRLRNIRVWSKDPKENAQAEKDAAQLIQMASEANRRRLKDPERIRGFLTQLRGTEEERGYAMRELYRAGPAAMPELINALGRAKDADERMVLLDVLGRMGPGAIPPMAAALDSNNARLKLDLLGVLRKNYAAHAKQIVPHLWYPSANKAEDPAVRQRAREMLAEFLDVPQSRLTPAHVALTRVAEQFYRGEAQLGDPKGVTVWRWDGSRVVQGWPGAETVPARQANEYWGLRFARQALNLDPTYRPAQETFLGLAIQSRPGPEVADLVNRASTELLIDLLDRALKERRRPEILAALRGLGNRAEPQARRPLGQADSPLIRALYYPDPRVQMEAVETLLQIPGPPLPKAAARVVEILANQLAPAATMRPGRKVLVAVSGPEFQTRVATAVEAAGAQPIVVGNGRDAMRRMRDYPYIDAILLDSTLPNPGLANLLAQMRQDVDFGRVPVLLAAIPQTRTAHELAQCFQRLQGRLELISAETRGYRAAMKQIEDEEAAAFQEVERAGFVRLDERETAERNVREKFALRRRLLDEQYLDAVRLTNDVPRLRAKSDRVAARYDLEAQIREGQLERFTARFPGVRVVHPSVLTDGKALEPTMTAAIRDADVALAEEDRDTNAARAIQLLAQLAQGSPPGYDIRPAADRILGALRAGRFKGEAAMATIYAAARLPGPRPQAELLNALVDANRPDDVRAYAGEGLVQAVARHGLLLTDKQVAVVHDLARQERERKAKGEKPTLSPRLANQLDVVLGALRPCDRKTGELLRRYDPPPVAPPAPKAEKKEKEEKEEKEDK